MGNGVLEGAMARDGIQEAAIPAIVCFHWSSIKFNSPGKMHLQLSQLQRMIWALCVRRTRRAAVRD